MIVRTQFGEKIELETFDDTLMSLGPGDIEVPAIVYFSAGSPYKDNLGPRIRIQEGDPSAPFDFNQAYPLFLGQPLKDLYDIQNRRPVLWKQLCQFVNFCSDELMEQWNDNEFAHDSFYYSNKIEQVFISRLSS